MWTVENNLVVGVRVDCCHKTVFNAEVVVENLCNRSEAVGCAGSVRNALYVLFTGLTMGNTYYVRVKDQCDNTSDVVAFSPACTSPSDLTVEPSSRSAEVTWLGGDSYNLRYRTAFVGLQEGFSSAPSGWLFRTGALNNDGTASLSGTSSWSSGTSNNVFDSHIYMNFYSTKNYWLITPSISIQDDCLFNFDVAYTAYSGSNATPAQNCTTHRFAVLISTDNMESWTILREWNNNGSSYSLDGISTTGDNVSISLSSYAGQTAYIAFFAHSETTSYDNNIHFDNVKIGKAPGSWMPSNSGTSASSPYTISNLSPETAYDVQVQATCEGDWNTSATWVAMSSGDLVFSGELTFTVNAWTTIDLDNPFAYDGSSNLLVGVADVTGDYTSSPHMACLVFNATSQAIRAYRDNTAYNITAPGVTGTVLSVKNQIELKITPSSAPICYTPRNLESVLTPGDGTVATLNWERHANGTENNWVLEYSTNSNFSGATSVNVSGTPTANLTGLAAETTYYARVKANCGGGSESGWTSTCEFTPTNVYAITVNDGSSTNGNVPIYGLWCDDITKSQFIIPSTALSTIQYGTINKLTFYSSNASVSWGSANFEVYMTETNETSISELVDYASMTKVMTAGSLSISGNIMEVTLSSPYQYLGGNLMIGFLQTVSGSYSSCSWYGVTATGASMGGYGTSISQQNFLPKITIEYTPSVAPTCPKPTNLTVSNVEARSAQLSWTAGGSETAWQICVNDDEANPISVTTNPYTLTGLTPETTYNVKVRANCGGDYSAWTSNSSFTTPIACPAPTSLTVSNVDTRSAQLSWTAGGSETAWQICINGDEAHPISVTTNPYTLTGLTPETDYDVKVRANCGGGDYSTWTSNESFTTLIACPAPTGLAYSDIEPGAATISWDDASVSGYNLRYGKAYTFDDGTMQGWTTIDADGDGYNWMLGSAVGGTYLVEGASLAGSGHNSSADLLSSGSFENVNITALTPDNYLVSPRINFGSGASIGFWACAQDVDFQSEHFGIAISTNGNTDPSDFTTIRECTSELNAGVDFASIRGRIYMKEGYDLSKVNEVGVVAYPAGSPDSERWFYGELDGEDFYVNMSELEQNTEYKYYLFAYYYDSYSRTCRSVESTFATEGSREFVVNTGRYSITGISNASALLYGEIVSGSVEYSSAIGFYYGNSPQTMTNFVEGELLSGQNTFTATLSGNALGW